MSVGGGGGSSRIREPLWKHRKPPAEHPPCDASAGGWPRRTNFPWLCFALSDPGPELGPQMAWQRSRTLCVQTLSVSLTMGPGSSQGGCLAILPAQCFSVFPRWANSTESGPFQALSSGAAESCTCFRQERRNGPSLRLYMWLLSQHLAEGRFSIYACELNNYAMLMTLKRKTLVMQNAKERIGILAMILLWIQYKM